VKGLCHRFAAFSAPKTHRRFETDCERDCSCGRAQNSSMNKGCDFGCDWEDS
jgi:hypothetical protein